MSDLLQLRQQGLFAARAPRYTSYPPANRFTAAVGAEQMRAWLGALVPGHPVSVYVHIPFCRRLCWFCACRTQGTRNAAPVAAYLRTLVAELRLIRAALPGPVPMARLHWGGGTPTLLTPVQIGRLARAIRAVFSPVPGAEFSVEIDPAELDAPRMDALARAGLTRASIGVQDFDPRVQAAIGREQGFDITRTAVAMARAAGIDSVNADVLYGLPHQDPTRMARTIEMVLALRPDRVALYGYAHVPWMARRQVMIPQDALPDPEARLALFDLARRRLLLQGYHALGIDHFALPTDSLARAAAAGRLRRNFQGYTDDSAPVLIGLGASAISRFPQGHVQNAPATGAYATAIRDGRMAAVRGHALGRDDVLRGALIEALMCDLAIDIPRMAARLDVPPAQIGQLLAPLRARFAPWLTERGDGLAIAPAGRPLTRLMAQMLDAGSDDPAPRHSAAV